MFSKKNVAGIDLGLANLAAIVSNQANVRPLLIVGKPLVALCNKGISSKLTLTSFWNRERKVYRYLRKSSRLIVDWLVENKIGILVIGDTFGKIRNLEKVTGHNFVSIIHSKFIGLVKDKVELLGIKVIVTEESFTSTASFLHYDPLTTVGERSGKRSKRVFTTKDGFVFNADVNAAFNIIRKVYPNRLRKYLCIGFENGGDGRWLRLIQNPSEVTPMSHT